MTRMITHKETYEFNSQDAFNSFINLLGKQNYYLADGKITMKKNGAIFQAGDEVGSYGMIMHKENQHHYTYYTFIVDLTAEVPAA